MKLLCSQEQVENTKYGHKTIPLQCYSCQGTFYSDKAKIQRATNRHHREAAKYCSNKCQGDLLRNKKEVECNHCHKAFLKKPSEIDRSPNNFCSRNCAATYNNTHKTNGYRRSRLEIWLEKQLRLLFPHLKFEFNKTSVIDLELDIYIPEAKLAIEINGIFHYKPIYGMEKLKRTKKNDRKKRYRCKKAGIVFHTINTSKLVHFNVMQANKYLSKIISYIGAAGYDPASSRL